jgi:hypothetical protein
MCIYCRGWSRLAKARCLGEQGTREAEGDESDVETSRCIFLSQGIVRGSSCQRTAGAHPGLPPTFGLSTRNTNQECNNPQSRLTSTQLASLVVPQIARARTQPQRAQPP